MVVSAQKRDGSHRFYVVNMMLKTLTVQNSYPLPHMYQCSDSLEEAAIFRRRSQTPATGKYKSARRTTKRLHSTSILVSSNSRDCDLDSAMPGHFQRATDVTLLSVKRRSALVYLDDIVFFSKTAKDHLVYIQQALMILKKSAVTVKLRSFPFFPNNWLSWARHLPWPIENCKHNECRHQRAKRSKKPKRNLCVPWAM